MALLFMSPKRSPICSHSHCMLLYTVDGVGVGPGRRINMASPPCSACSQERGAAMQTGFYHVVTWSSKVVLKEDQLEEPWLLSDSLFFLPAFSSGQSDTISAATRDWSFRRSKPLYSSWWQTSSVRRKRPWGTSLNGRMSGNKVCHTSPGEGLPMLATCPIVGLSQHVSAKVLPQLHSR